MKVFLQVGKTAVAVFWLLVLFNLISPLNKPVDLLLNGLGALVLLAHIVELALFGNRLRGLPSVNLHRAQVLLFGIFHLYGLAEPAAPAEAEAPVAEPVATAAAADAAEVEHA